MPFKHVLVASDFSECSQTAVDEAVDIAKRYGATLTLVHAFQPPTAYGGYLIDNEVTQYLRRGAEAQLAKALDAIRARFPPVTGIVRCGPAWEEILEVARKEGADLIVVGSHGRKGLPRAMLGSVAEKVVRMSPVPVLTMHGGNG